MTLNLHRAMFAAVALSACLEAVGCDRSNTPASASAGTEDAARSSTASPVESVVRINRLRWDRQYDALQAAMAGDNTIPTIRFLKSIDRVLDAHDRLQENARRQFGDQIHHAWNVNAMQNNLGIFSRDIHIISQSLGGDTAEVTLQAADRVPLVRANFRRVDGEWKLVSSIADDDICNSLDEFAARIDSVADRITDGLTPTGYFDAVTRELLPGMAQIARGESLDNIRVTDATPDDQP